MKWYQVEISLYHDTLAKSGFLTVGMCKYKNIFLLFFQSFLSSTIAGHKVCHCRRRRRQASSSKVVRVQLPCQGNGSGRRRQRSSPSAVVAVKKGQRPLPHGAEAVKFGSSPTKNPSAASNGQGVRVLPVTTSDSLRRG